MITPSPVKEHFNKLADNYDYFKEKNWYYYQNLKKLLCSQIPPQQNILEIGCGTGDLLATLQPQKGIGIDISDKMINIATKKYTKDNLEFHTVIIENLQTSVNFDYIFLSDVIEHLEDIQSTLQAIKNLTSSNTQLIITMANPIWEPILHIAEKLKLKMPEGPHQRISIKETHKHLQKTGFLTQETEYRLLIPKYIPIITEALNPHFYKIPLIKKLGFITLIKAIPNDK